MISRLQVLSVFFGNDLIYKIYLRSQIIHKLFEENPELDINKLELFHLQYTSALLDLLKKIKKNNEKSIDLLSDELGLNTALIAQIQSPIFTRQNFELDKQRQALKINTSLRNLYLALSDSTTDYPFTKNINVFSSRFSHDFYYEIPPALMGELASYTPDGVYTNAYAVIEKKLLGVLCKYDFKSSFYCGLKVGEQVAEVYKLNDTDRYFIFFPSKGLFLFCDIGLLSGVPWVTDLAKREQFIRELTDKNDQLKNTIDTVKNSIPPEIELLLMDNYKKLNDINFLQNISSVDVQANILKSMLNTDMM